MSEFGLIFKNKNGIKSCISQRFLKHIVNNIGITMKFWHKNNFSRYQISYRPPGETNLCFDDILVASLGVHTIHSAVDGEVIKLSHFSGCIAVGGIVSIPSYIYVYYVYWKCFYEHAYGVYWRHIYMHLSPNLHTHYAHFSAQMCTMCIWVFPFVVFLLSFAIMWGGTIVLFAIV